MRERPGPGDASHRLLVHHHCRPDDADILCDLDDCRPDHDGADTFRDHDGADRHQAAGQGEAAGPSAGGQVDGQGASYHAVGASCAAAEGASAQADDTTEGTHPQALLDVGTQAAALQAGQVHADQLPEL